MPALRLRVGDNNSENLTAWVEARSTSLWAKSKLLVSRAGLPAGVQSRFLQTCCLERCYSKHVFPQMQRLMSSASTEHF